MDDVLRNVEQLDQALARLIRRMQAAVRDARREFSRTQAYRARPRTLEAGPRQLERKSTGELARDHVDRTRRYGDDYPDQQRQQVAREFDRRGLAETAAVVGAGAAGAAAAAEAIGSADWTEEIRRVLDQAENPAYPDSLADQNLQNGLDDHIAADSELSAHEQEVVNAAPMTQQDFLEDMAESGVDPEVVDNFAFAADGSPNDLSEAISQQHEQEAPAVVAEESHDTAALEIDQPDLEI